jgi:hypothetical protein
MPMAEGFRETADELAGSVCFLVSKPIRVLCLLCDLCVKSSVTSDPLIRGNSDLDQF